MSNHTMEYNNNNNNERNIKAILENQLKNI